SVRPPPPAPAPPPPPLHHENTPNPLAPLAAALAHKCVSHGRVYAVLFLSKPQRAAMAQAASPFNGLRLRNEGEAHWARLVFEPHKPSPMPQKSLISLEKENPAHKRLRALASGRG
ncbi:MAG: hypothetical protein FWD46_09645, partial [Cystobacterineae bacterium]|nr:hypothetical protein [Cystobacterineae bacterium]